MLRTALDHVAGSANTARFATLSCRLPRNDLRSPADLHAGSASRELVYTASCGDCRHWTRVDLKRIAAQLGDEFPLRDLRPRLKCAKCAGKRIIISTVDKDSTAAASHLSRWRFPYD